MCQETLKAMSDRTPIMDPWPSLEAAYAAWDRGEPAATGEHLRTALNLAHHHGYF